MKPVAWIDDAGRIVRRDGFIDGGYVGDDRAIPVSWCPLIPVSQPKEKNCDVAVLRAALVGLIGADTEAELRQMEATMRILPAPEADKAASINAIHALLATMGK